MKATTKYGALDVHQATTVASVREANGRVMARAVLPTEEAAIVEFFRGMRVWRMRAPGVAVVAGFSGGNEAPHVAVKLAERSTASRPGWSRWTGSGTPPLRAASPPGRDRPSGPPHTPAADR